MPCDVVETEASVRWCRERELECLPFGPGVVCQPVEILNFSVKGSYWTVSTSGRNHPHRATGAVAGDVRAPSLRGTPGCWRERGRTGVTDRGESRASRCRRGRPRPAQAVSGRCVGGRTRTNPCISQAHPFGLSALIVYHSRADSTGSSPRLATRPLLAASHDAARRRTTCTMFLGRSSRYRPV